MTEVVQTIVRYGFDTLDLDLLSAYCYPHNVRSKRVHFKKAALPMKKL
ncbi:hypothetical protein Psfp_02740 [Pelotomaculum sp. FP]|nr:hypothetical protein Psfp_02740 [Pelotomaculum sp. FP]